MSRSLLPSIRFWAPTLLGLAGAIFAPTTVVRGEIFELFNGGRVEGTLLNTDESPRKTYVIQTKAGQLTLTAAQVKGIAAKSEEEIWYETNLPRMPNDVAGHLTMAAECKSRKLEAQRVYHLEQVLKVEPDNETARRELGYSRLEGAWIKTDLWHRERGFVKDGGRWRLPQEVAMDKAAAERKEAEATWTKQIRIWRQWILKYPDRSAEAVAGFRAIDDPAAAAPLILLLKEKKEPAELRKLYIDVLGTLPGNGVSSTLTELALIDPDPLVRDRALDKLVQRNDRFAARLLIGVVTKFSEGTTPIEQNQLVNLAAAGLGRLKAEEATIPLINALVTRHKDSSGGGSPGSLSPTFTQDPNSGAGGFSFGGGGPKSVTRELTNATVRDALIAIYPGINHGFNQNAWRLWYQQMRTPVIVNLRREN